MSHPGTVVKAVEGGRCLEDGHRAWGERKNTWRLALELSGVGHADVGYAMPGYLLGPKVHSLGAVADASLAVVQLHSVRQVVGLSMGCRQRRGWHATVGLVGLEVQQWLVAVVRMNACPVELGVGCHIPADGSTLTVPLFRVGLDGSPLPFGSRVCYADLRADVCLAGPV